MHILKKALLIFIKKFKLDKFIQWYWNIPLCNPDWPETLYKDHVGLVFKDIHLPLPSGVLELKEHTTTPWKQFRSLNNNQEKARTELMCLPLPFSSLFPSFIIFLNGLLYLDSSSFNFYRFQTGYCIDSQSNTAGAILGQVPGTMPSTLCTSFFLPILGDRVQDHTAK